MFFWKKAKKMTTETGIDSEGQDFGIEIADGEEVSKETFKELSNGTGGAEGYE